MANWTLNPLFAIGIVLAVMFFGYFFGLFEGRGQGYKKRQKEEAEDRKQRPSMEPLPPASPPVPSDEVPVLDVSMAPNGQLRLQMDGRRMNTSALDAEQRKRLVAILTQMRPWLEAPTSTPSAGPGPVPSPRAASSPKVPPPARAMLAPTPSLSSKPTRAPSPASKPAAPSTAEEDEPSVLPESIVAQIDSVLQVRLVSTPLAGKGIRLQESPEGGVLVWVGINKYESIDDVPDEQIKAAIRAAITEWENKYTPGL
ncbi:MAG: hypothetical protein JW963_00610 [Anaerolineales bacterium]|nr:hypothetical protein [Anaerolineales bacterium]